MLKKIIHETISKTESDTNEIAKKLANIVENGDVILLYGDVGMGKTVFSRALIRALYGMPEMEVTSPTFNLVNVYDRKMPHIWHFDLYRINCEDELYELGWEEALISNIVIVEWAEKLIENLPKKALELHFSLSEGHRKVIFKGDDDWKKRLVF